MGVAPPKNFPNNPDMLDLAQLQQIFSRHEKEYSHPVRSFSLGNLNVQEGARHLMGVVNLSPDSWYRESVSLTTIAAVRRGRVLTEQGAGLIDIGAESSLAHAERVGESMQKSRLIPVITELVQSGILVSAETYRPEVALACLRAGARVLNLTGTEGSETMYRMAAEHDAALILCFVQGNNVREVSNLELGSDPVGAMYEYFAREVEKAERCGVSRIWVDPGLGFYYRNLQDSATRIQHQMTVFLNTFRLRKLGWPVCHALPHAFECFEEEVRCAEPFFAVLALLGKTDLLRTHEVSRVRAVLETMKLFGAASK